jgi:hypothetical protein
MASQRASKKPKTGMEKISTIMAKEEETNQKVLELKKLRVKGENDKVLAKIKAKADTKMCQIKLRAELEQKKMDNNFRLQMAQMGHAYPSSEVGSNSMVHNNIAAPGSGYSGSVTPGSTSGYFNKMPQLDLSLEFFGQNSGYDFNHHFPDHD